MIRIRDRQVEDCVSIRDNLHAFYKDHFGKTLRFAAGQQECASEALDRLLDHIQTVDGNYRYPNQVSCSNPLCPDPNIAAGDMDLGKLHTIFAKDRVEEMICTQYEHLDPTYVHSCQVTPQQIRDEFERLDNSEHFIIARRFPYSATDSHEQSYQKLIAKYKALDDNGIQIQRIGNAIPTIQVNKIQDPQQFLIFAATRNPLDPKETYPTEVLTIDGQQYVIRSIVVHEGHDPRDGHYKSFVFSNNRWYEVNDFCRIKELQGEKPWPKLGTIYFYEKLGENEPVPIPVEEANYLPPAVQEYVKQPTTSTTSTTTKNKNAVVHQDVDLENVLEQLKEIHRQGIDKLNVGESNVSNLTPENPVLQQGLLMLENFKKDFQRTDPCVMCNESWFTNFTVNEKNGMCNRCEGLAKKNLSTFGEANQMVPGPVPQCIKDLTYVELCAIKMAQPCMNVYCRKGGKTGLVGHTITYEQKVQELAKELPLAGEDMPFCILQKDGQTPKEFTVRPHLLREALEYLIKHSQPYKHVKISERNLQTYVDSNGVVEGIPVLNYDFDYDQEVEQEDMENINERDMVKEADLGGDVAAPQSMVQMQTCTTNIRDIIDKAIRAKEKKDLNTPKFAYPERSTKPLSEFAQFYYAMCYPNIFPDGNGDYNMVRFIFSVILGEFSFNINFSLIFQPRTGDTPNFKDWVQHIIRQHDGRALEDPVFV